MGCYMLLPRVYKHNINDPKDYGVEDICNHGDIKEKNKTMLFFPSSEQWSNY